MTQIWVYHPHDNGQVGKWGVKHEPPTLTLTLFLVRIYTCCKPGLSISEDRCSLIALRLCKRGKTANLYQHVNTAFSESARGHDLMNNKSGFALKFCVAVLRRQFDKLMLTDLRWDLCYPLVSNKVFHGGYVRTGHIRMPMTIPNQRRQCC